MEFTFAPAPFKVHKVEGWPGPGWTGGETSIWGNLLAASDGTVYVSLCNHGMEDGSNALFRYDPKTDSSRKVFDAVEQFGPPKRPTEWGHGKNHCRIMEGSDGKIYSGTTCSTSPPMGVPYEGGHLFSYDPKTDAVEDLGIPVPGIGIHSIWVDERRGMIWGLVISGQNNPRRAGFGYNITYRRTEILLDTPVPEDCFMDLQGRFYAQIREGYLCRYDHDHHEFKELRSIPMPQDPLIHNEPEGGRGTLSKITCNSANLAKDGRVFLTTMGGQLFILHPDREEDGQIELLGPAIGDGTYCVPQFNLALTPDATALYYLADRAFSYHPDLGPTSQLVRYDLPTGRRTHLGWLEADPPTTWRSFAGGVSPDGTVYFGIQPQARLAIYHP